MWFNTNQFKKYFGNISWLMVEKVFTMAIGMVVSIYVARYLQPEKYGLLNYAMSFVGMFAAFSELGLNSIFIREMAQKPKEQNRLLGTTFALRLMGSGLLFLALFITVTILRTDSFTNMLIFIIAAGEIFKAFEVINDFYLSKVLAKYISRVLMVNNVLLAMVKLFLVYIEAPLAWFAGVILLGTIFNALGFAYTYWKQQGSLFNWEYKKSLAKDLIRESWPLIIYGFALYVQARVDQVMLGKMLNNYEVGQYSVALKFIEMLGFVPMAFMNTFSPAVAKAKKESEEKYQNRLLNLYRLMFATFLVIALPLYFLAEPIIVLLFGESYQAAGFLLSLFAIRLFFTHMGVGKSVFIVNESLFKYSLVTAIIGALSNIAINYVLIPDYASVGAIAASIASFIISIFLVDAFYPPVRKNLRLMFKGIFSFWKLKEAH